MIYRLGNTAPATSVKGRHAYGQRSATRKPRKEEAEAGKGEAGRGDLAIRGGAGRGGRSAVREEEVVGRRAVDLGAAVDLAGDAFILGP